MNRRSFFTALFAAVVAALWPRSASARDLAKRSKFAIWRIPKHWVEPIVVHGKSTEFKFRLQLEPVGQEWDGVVRRGAKLLHAFGEAVVPRVTLVTRKAYGGAYIAMNSRSLGATKVFAWPTAEVAVMGAVAAIRVLHRRILADVPDDQRDAMELELAAEHEKISGGVERAIEIGVVDEIIQPNLTRSAIAQAIAKAPQLRGAHGNIPL